MGVALIILQVYFSNNVHFIILILMGGIKIDHFGRSTIIPYSFKYPKSNKKTARSHLDFLLL